MTSYRFFAVFGLAMVACGPSETLPDNDAGTSTNDAGKACGGVCVPVPRVLWDGPYLLWVGDKANAPLCSDVSDWLGEVYSGYGYLDDATLCGACTCAPSVGSCELPATLTTAAVSCAGDGPSVAHVSFDPPTDWTGTCTAENAIPAGKLCGGVPCVQSVTAAPLTMKQGGCLPIEAPNVKPPAASKFARACGTGGVVYCTERAGICTPAAPGPEWKQCVAIRGDSDLSECPLEYPNRNIFYSEPTPYCTPCACDAPIGSHCTGSIEVFAKSTCTPAVYPTLQLGQESATCVDLPAGSALGSKSANNVHYSPGHCEPSGGKPEGIVFCCQP
jgi:hypothetical protein